MFFQREICFVECYLIVSPNWFEISTESVLEASTEQLDSRSRYAEKCEKRIEEMDHEIEQLQSVLSNLKVLHLLVCCHMPLKSIDLSAYLIN